MQTWEKIINDENISFKYAKGASTLVGREFHPYHEIIFFYGQSAHLFSDTVNAVIEPGTLIIIPKETYHQLNIIGDDTDYKRGVLHFTDKVPLSSFAKKAMAKLYITKPDEKITYLFDKLKELTCQSLDQNENSSFLSGVLSLILYELSLAPAQKSQSAPGKKTQEALALIADNIGGDLSIESLASQLNISPSLLSHIFKKDMNISLHKYIMKKRLTRAFEKISEGTPSAVAAAECGFGEYTNFYRQYKKTFGFCPSQKPGKI